VISERQLYLTLVVKLVCPSNRRRDGRSPRTGASPDLARRRVHGWPPMHRAAPPRGRLQRPTVIDVSLPNQSGGRRAAGRLSEPAAGTSASVTTRSPSCTLAYLAVRPPPPAVARQRYELFCSIRISHYESDLLTRNVIA